MSRDRGGREYISRVHIVRTKWDKYGSDWVLRVHEGDAQRVYFRGTLRTADGSWPTLEQLRALMQEAEADTVGLEWAPLTITRTNRSEKE